jgi:hypothetical protein
MKKIRKMMHRLNDWTRIAMNDPSAVDRSHSVQGWPPVA